MFWRVSILSSTPALSGALYFLFLVIFWGAVMILCKRWLTVFNHAKYGLLHNRNNQEYEKMPCQIDIDQPSNATRFFFQTGCLPRATTWYIAHWVEWLSNRRIEYWAICSSIRSFARTAHSFACSRQLAQTFARSLSRSLIISWEEGMWQSNSTIWNYYIP